MALNFLAEDCHKSLPSLSSEARRSPLLFFVGGGAFFLVLFCEPILCVRPLKDDWQEARLFIKHTHGRASTAAAHDPCDGGHRNSSVQR